MRRAAALLLTSLLLCSWARGQETGQESQQESEEDYEIDLSQIEKEIAKKAYTLGGFLEFEPMLMVLDREAVFYKLRFPGQERRTLDRYDLGLRLEGSYEKGIAGLHFTGDGYFRNDQNGWTGKVDLFQGYLSLRINSNVTVDAGKRVTKWGKGYAWNPVSFVDRRKDPEDPQEALEGFYVLSADFIKSFGGALKTFAFTPVVVPVTRRINEEFGQRDRVNFGGKAYFLLWDTDIDFLFLAGESRTSRYGVDFSKNLRSNFEIHGEWAWITDFDRTGLLEPRTARIAGETVVSALFGARYLSANETTVLAEYYHNGEGFPEEDLRDFYDSVRSSDTGADPRSVPEPLQAPNFMRDYLYLRASQKEPFRLLYFTPEIASIISLGDRSLILIPGLTYSPRTNLQVRIRSPFLTGSRGTEYGEKQNDMRFECRLRYFF